MSTAAPSASGSPSTNDKILFWASFFTLIAAGIGFSVRGVSILEAWGNQYGFTQAELGTITGGGLLMLGGRLGDLLGRRRTLLVGTTLFGAASLLAGLAPTFGVLVVARLAQGAGEAIALPAAMATIVLLFPEGPARTRALSVWAAVASCGLVLGFALSGIITAHLGWRWIFLALAVLDGFLQLRGVDQTAFDEQLSETRAHLTVDPIASAASWGLRR